MVGEGIGSGEAEEAAVEEVAVEPDFSFGGGVAVDLLDDEGFELIISDPMADSYREVLEEAQKIGFPHAH